MKRAPLLLGLPLVLLAVACGSSAPTSAGAQLTSGHADAHPAIAKVWHSRCGSCHKPVEPGARDRAYLETALKRHRTRVRLDEAGWKDMVDFLAAPSASAQNE